jgi:hypothetical protein
VSKIRLTPNASGTGTVTLTVPSTSTDRTITLPDTTGTLLDSSGQMWDLWRLPSNFLVTGSNLATAVTVTGWERNDTSGFAKIGTGLTESSGIFTFPSTGIYLIRSGGVWGTTANNYQTTLIETTQDNSTYTEQALAHCWNNTNDYASQNCEHIFDVTDTSLCKFQIKALRDYANNNLIGNTVFTYTYVLVQRLGDT